MKVFFSAFPRLLVFFFLTSRNALYIEAFLHPAKSLLTLDQAGCIWNSSLVFVKRRRGRSLSKTQRCDKEWIKLVIIDCYMRLWLLVGLFLEELKLRRMGKLLKTFWRLLVSLTTRIFFEKCRLCRSPYFFKCAVEGLYLLCKNLNSYLKVDDAVVPNVECPEDEMSVRRNICIFKHKETGEIQLTQFGAGFFSFFVQ